MERVNAVLARIEALNPRLNTFLTVAVKGAAEAAGMRGEPLGLLHGLPVSIKDLEPTMGRC